MKRPGVWLIPFVALALCLAVRWSEPAALVLLQCEVFDRLQRMFPAIWEDAAVRVVDIDDESLARIGQWPWPRTTVAALVDRLTDGGAAAIAFDVVFAEPDRTSPTQILQIWGSSNPDLTRAAEALPDHDAVLARALARAPAVLGFPMTYDVTAGARAPIIRPGFATAGDAQSVDPRPFLTVYGSAVANLATLESSAAGQGDFTVDFDHDGVIRRVPLVVGLARPNAPAQYVPLLPAEALRVAQRASTYVIRSSGASGQTAFGQQSGINAIRIGDFVVPTDSFGQMWLRDTGPVPQRTIPAWRLLAGNVPQDEIDGRIFFVGTSAPGLRDQRATPLDATAAGVDVHARIVEQILTGDFLQRPDWMRGFELAWLLFFSLAIILLMPRTGPIVAAVIAALGVLVPFGLSVGLLLKRGWLVDPVYPAASVLLIYILQSMLIFAARERDRRFVRSAFSRYMSPTQVEMIARNPDLLKLGGEMRELSILFCDIRGFTSRSEKMQAQELTHFLNRFLTPMTECILAEGGTIDKYMGDAIMAFWNAPLDEPDHPARIARAALAMVDRLAALNQDWAAEAAAAGHAHEPLAIGIGINLGMACVGNMGSDQRFDYSIIGDAVNTASRLEGLSKNYGVPIVVGEALAARLADFALVPLDLAKVRGKEQPVRIFTLLDGKPAGDPAIVRLAAAHTAVLAALEDGNADAAHAALAEARAVGDTRFAATHALYAERIRGLTLGEVRQGVAVAGH
jgi:adenylate cyclase